MQNDRDTTDVGLHAGLDASGNRLAFFITSETGPLKHTASYYTIIYFYLKEVIKLNKSFCATDFSCRP
jgi:hypothetical protein